MTTETQLYQIKAHIKWKVVNRNIEKKEIRLNSNYGNDEFMSFSEFHHDYEPVPATCEQESGWRDISEAPMDGTEVMLWVSGYRGIIMAYWYNQEDRWRTKTSERWGKDIPTHFMPLPQPPKAESGEDKE